MFLGTIAFLVIAALTAILIHDDRLADKWVTEWFLKRWKK